MFDNVFCRDRDRAEELAQMILDSGSWESDLMQELAALLGLDVSECELCEDIARVIYDATGVDLE